MCFKISFYFFMVMKIFHRKIEEKRKEEKKKEKRKEKREKRKEERGKRELWLMINRQEVLNQEKIQKRTQKWR